MNVEFESKVVYLVWKCDGCHFARVRRTKTTPDGRYQSPCPDEACPVKKKRLITKDGANRVGPNVKEYDTREEAQAFADVVNGVWL